MTSALEARSLYRFFRSGDEETLALQGVSLIVERGEVVTVTGPSGSGKSTLMACLAGLDEPAGGTVRIAGERMSHRPESERAALRGRSIGMLFQSNNLLSHLTISDNITLVQNLNKTFPVAPLEILDSVGLAGRARALPTQLSGGENARAGLAVALATSPTVILADEPTGELDGVTEERLLELLREHAGRGAAVVIVTHSPDVVAYADRSIALEDGRLQS